MLVKTKAGFFVILLPELGEVIGIKNHQNGNKRPKSWKKNVNPIEEIMKKALSDCNYKSFIIESIRKLAILWKKLVKMNQKSLFSSKKFFRVIGQKFLYIRIQREILDRKMGSTVMVSLENWWPCLKLTLAATSSRVSSQWFAIQRLRSIFYTKMEVKMHF